MRLTSNPFHVPSQGSHLYGKYRQAWVEEAFDLETTTNKRCGLTHTKNYLGASITPRRFFIFYFIIILCLLIIFSKIFYLQIIAGSYYRTLAEGNRIRLRPIPAERGIIYDHFKKQLVSNVASFSLVAIPHDLPRSIIERGRSLEALSVMSGINVDVLEKILSKFNSSSYESVTIKENLDYETALKLYIQNATLPGVGVESGTRRYYNLEFSSSTPTLSFSHILGYLGKLDDSEIKAATATTYLPSDSIGKTGIEKTYEPYLRGVYGRKKIEVNALGKEQAVLAVEPPTPGKNLFLSIDAEAQNKLEELARKTAEKFGKHKIAAIAINPNDGHIMALFSWPSFNNNDFASGITGTTYQKYLTDSDNPLFNRTISGLYPSGSTIKLIVAAAALQEKVVSAVSTFNSVGGLKVGRWYFKDWKAGGHGLTNVIKALAWSVNTFFYYIGGGYDSFTGLGLDRLLRYMKLFNIAQLTKIDLPGEGSGFLPSKEWKKQTKGEPWFIGDTYNLSIGQGDLLVTPLQVSIWTSAIANGGSVVQPRVVEKIIDPATKEITPFKDVIVRTNFISPENIGIVQRGMRECVLSGSCKLLQTLPFTSAGKTGTAQWSQNRDTHAWFTSFAPFDKPKIVVTVLVEEGGEGATVAMPIARDFLAWWGKKYLP